MKGKVKKVIALTSGHADLDLINEFEVEISAVYAASKAALNVVVAKFNAQYKKDGVLFMSMSPGVVEVGHYNESACIFFTDTTIRLANSDPQAPRNRCKE